MSALRNLFLTLAAACMSAVAADQSLLRLLPQDAMFIAGVNADQIKSSRFGHFILDQLKDEEHNINKFISMTGFDPRRDLQELIVASTHARKDGKTLVLARGRFDSTRISSFASSAGAGAQRYAGVEILSAPGNNSQGWLAILDTSTVLAGDQDSVKAALDRRGQNTAGAISAATVNKINDLSSKYDAWMISSSLASIADDFRNPQMGNAMTGNFMQGLESVIGGVRFGPNIDVMAEATMRSEKDAQALVDVVKFLTGMLQLNSEDKKAAEFTRLLDGMELRASGNQFKMQMTIPEDVVENILKPAANIRRKKI